jgi:hypothetical protein
MGNSNYSGGRYWEPTEAASIPAATVALSDSIRDQVIGKFATTGDRNTALAALPVGERAGSIAYVPTVGWFGYDGTVWVDLSTHDQQADIRRTRYIIGFYFTDVSGIFEVPIVPALPGSIEGWIVQPQQVTNPALVAVVYAANPTRLYCKLHDAGTGAPVTNTGAFRCNSIAWSSGA